MINKIEDVMKTPEERFTQQVWKILQEIKGEILATPKGKPVKHEVPSPNKQGTIPTNRRVDILHKLEERGVFKIKESSGKPSSNVYKIYYLYIIQPKFDKVYKKFQKACDINSYLNDYQQKAFKGKKLPKFSQVKQEKTKIDKWLESKNNLTLRKIWQVVSVLNAEWQLRDEDVFDVPHDKFERARITNSKDLEVILKTLHKYAVIKVSKKIMASLPVDPNKSRSLLDIELEKLKMAENADIQIRIFPKLFTYLRDTLVKMVSEKPQEKYKQDKKPCEESVEWFKDFKWQGKSFVFGKYGNIDFISEATPKKLFRMLSDAKGNWVAIAKISKEIKKDTNYIRSTIGQIRKRLPRHINIPSTRDDDLEPKPIEGGAYRIKFAPKP